MVENKRRITKLNSFYGKKLEHKYMHKYFCKSRAFKATFKGSEFSHVNFRGSIMTSVSFKSCKFEGVEFLGTNLKKSNFEGASFKDTIFVGALLENCNFRNTTFKNVIMVNTNVNNTKNLNIHNPEITILKQYPKLEISLELKNVLGKLVNDPYISRYRVLHLNTKKYNHLNLKILFDVLSEEQLIKGLKIMKEKNKKEICTVSSLINYLKMVLGV
ncbi:hypothetical protein N752_17310 [Desulforamulus aquiferis]|nr:pentapeptide repeat-containing protein [Desulforamulus aquiferis]RYD03845.1 hypothetical protein N752_17310 [Desulforamulus aquiferis]